MIQVLLRPIKTEKSTAAAQKGNFTFLVGKDATKGQIRQLISEMFKVDVVRVRTVAKKGKSRKSGKKRLTYQLPDRKHAIVKLAKGQSIELFEAEKKGKKKE